MTARPGTFCSAPFMNKTVPAFFVALSGFSGFVQAQAPAATPEQLAEGKKNYMTVCIACHQPTGMGLPMVFPPLTKSPYVNGSAERFAAIILKGNAPPFTVDGKVYAATLMPAQELMLDDAKIASIMTFVRVSFENNAPPVSADVVAAARKKFADRKTPWTQKELDEWKE
jgi:mono/diheme cytochrome c family protein